MTDDEWVAFIAAARSDEERLQAIDECYRDYDRAERLDRQILYFHMGLLIGTAMRLAGIDRRPRPMKDYGGDDGSL